MQVTNLQDLLDRSNASDRGLAQQLLSFVNRGGDQGNRRPLQDDRTFAEKDRNNDGVLSRREMMDVNNDGNIDANELRSFADTDGNGIVTMKELQQALGTDGDITFDDIRRLLDEDEMPAGGGGAGGAKGGRKAEGGDKGKGSDKAEGGGKGGAEGSEKPGGDSGADKPGGAGGPGKTDTRSFDEMDANNDGKISAREAADTNGDNEVSAEEAEAFAEKNDITTAKAGDLLAADDNKVVTLAADVEQGDG